MCSHFVGVIGFEFGSKCVEVGSILHRCLNIFRFVLQELDGSTHQWVNLLLLRQAYLSIPFLLLSFPLMLYLCWSFGNATIFAYFHTMQVQNLNDPSKRKSQEEDKEQEVDEEDRKKNVKSPPFSRASSSF
jgi:hypothetical protein